MLDVVMAVSWHVRAGDSAEPRSEKREARNKKQKAQVVVIQQQ